MAGLLDFAQSASNAIAGNVSAPVDGIAWLMRKLGLPIPKDPVGGSNWLEDRGLTRQVPQSAASLAGETVGLLAPTAIMANAPKIAQGLLKMADNAAIPRALNPQAGVIGWHGSPHKFEKFSMDKIGTGEGAQAYGHGLYLAESPDVARSYLKSNGTGEDLTVSLGGKDVVWGSELTQQQLDALKLLEGGKRQAGQFPHNTAYYAKKMTDDPALHKIIDEWKDAKIGYKSHSTMYKTDIPEEAVARFLDWDKPLSQQSKEAMNSLKAAYKKKTGVSDRYMESEFLPNRSLNDAIGGGRMDQSLTQALLESGVPGIKYLDGGSRKGGVGSSNFVVFDPEMIRILERNGQATGAAPWQPGEWRGLLGNN